MRVIIDGKIVETDKHIINGHEVVSDDNWEDFDYLREQRTWAKLQGGMQIATAKENYEAEKRRVEIRRRLLASLPE